jgi:hypothetical protein
MKDLERLAEEITELAAHINAATAEWLELIAEFDRRDGWWGTGCKSCAHWVAWRCSLSPHAARERVRVARRLEELPLVRAAFARGELSRFHHLLVHEGGFGVRREGDGALVFLRPGGRVLRAVPRQRRGDRGEMCARTRRRGAEVTPLTVVPRCADRLDLDLAVDAFVAWSSPPPPPPAWPRPQAAPSRPQAAPTG